MILGISRTRTGTSCCHGEERSLPRGSKIVAMAVTILHPVPRGRPPHEGLRGHGESGKRWPRHTVSVRFRACAERSRPSPQGWDRRKPARSWRRPPRRSWYWWPTNQAISLASTNWSRFLAELAMRMGSADAHKVTAEVVELVSQMKALASEPFSLSSARQISSSIQPLAPWMGLTEVRKVTRLLSRNWGDKADEAIDPCELVDCVLPLVRGSGRGNMSRVAFAAIAEEISNSIRLGYLSRDKGGHQEGGHRIWRRRGGPAATSRGRAGGPATSGGDCVDGHTPAAFSDHLSSEHTLQHTWVSPLPIWLAKWSRRTAAKLLPSRAVMSCRYWNRWWFSTKPTSSIPSTLSLLRASLILLAWQKS